MQLAKIFVTGPLLAGKTTLIQTVSELDVKPIQHSKLPIPPEQSVATKLYMDFGRIMADEETALYLFGDVTLGPYARMWSIILREALGSIVVLDCRRPETCPQVVQIVEKIWEQHAPLPLLIAANYADESSREELAAHLDLNPEVIFPCDVRNRDEVKALLAALLYHHVPNPLVERLIAKLLRM